MLVAYACSDKCNIIRWTCDDDAPAPRITMRSRRSKVLIMIRSVGLSSSFEAGMNR